MDIGEGEFNRLGVIRALPNACGANMLCRAVSSRAAGAFTNEREMHTTGKIYVTKRYIYSSCSTLIEDYKIILSGIALKIAG